MFWKLISGVTRFSVAAHRSVTALGVATIIAVGVYDFLKARKDRDRLR
mgnify:CR=1 FL=1